MEDRGQVMDIVFDELGRKERVLLLRACDYDVDEEGYVLNSEGERLKSEENPSEHLHVDNSAMIPGSLKVIDGSPSSISKFIREKIEK